MTTAPITLFLDDAGVDYTFHHVPGYGTPDNPSTRGHTNYVFDPSGMLVHYPVGIDDDGVDSILQLILRGHPAAPKPIYQIYVDHAAGNPIHVISEGRANHAGNGWSGRIDDAKADREPTRSNPGDNIGGNRYWIGISLEGPATTLPQRLKAARVVAAICYGFGWSANRVLGHYEWTNRKTDPDFDMTWFRGEVAHQIDQLKGDTMTKPLTPAEQKAIARLEAERVFTTFTTDEPGEVDTAVTIRKLAVFLDRLLDATVGAINTAIDTAFDDNADADTGEYVTRDQVVALIVDELTN